MGECKIDHSKEDVQKKFESQQEYLPQDIQGSFSNFLMEEHTQDILNEVFHLLKKYDLANEDERNERNNRLNLILKNL
ncbi:hypothetical protein [Mesobacillus thioparans]|uniref:hypothetical protein n=1 Tax=Mesobacillus thioparans TaxID=370439 RepID=UPI0039EFBEC5